MKWVQTRKDDHWRDAEIYATAAARLPHISPLLLTDPRSPRPRRSLGDLYAAAQKSMA